MNLQYVEERQAQVEAIRGKSVRESVPESFLRTADEIEIVDAPPEYCVTRAAAEPGEATHDLARLERQMSELREAALLLAAEVVDHQLEDYLRRAGIDQVYGTHERILVCITPRSHASLMIRRGRRQADRFHGDLCVVHVRQEGHWAPRTSGSSRKIWPPPATPRRTSRCSRGESPSVRSSTSRRSTASPRSSWVTASRAAGRAAWDEPGRAADTRGGGHRRAGVPSRMSDPSGGTARTSRGRLKVFLGYAAGVGKTFRMLDEAQSLLAQGHDLVVGYFEPHGRQDTIAKLDGLEVVPRRRIEYRGHGFEEMDTDAVLARRPEICAVDEFAHTNVPGSVRAKRWEDVTVLLEAGIDVLTTMNVQHLESLNDQLQEITGIKVRETIPDWVVKEADEVVLIDLPPRALLNRLLRGVVYPPEKAERAMESFFKEPTLAALRELALRQTAHEVDLRHADGGGAAPAASGSNPAGTRRGAGPTEARERILIHVTDRPTTTGLIRRGRRVADYLRGDCFAVVPDAREAARRARPDRGAPRLRAAAPHRDAHPGRRRRRPRARRVRAGRGRDPDLALPRPARRLLPLLSRRDTTMRVVALAHDIQVTVVADRGKAGL